MLGREGTHFTGVRLVSIMRDYEAIIITKLYISNASFIKLEMVSLVHFIIIIIIIIKIESVVQGRERVRTLYQSEDPNPTQPTHGRKKKRK